MNKSFYKIVTVVLIGIITFSCAEEEDEAQIQPTFENSAVIIQNGLNKGKSDGAEVKTIEIISFNEEYQLAEGYNIEGNKYSDDGQFNDEQAGDGIYTFIEDDKNFNPTENTNEQLTTINFGENFKHLDKLNRYLKISGLNKVGGKIGCSVRTTTCVETSWWNSCWPMKSPCTCVEFYDCKIEVSF
ncbi:hypothetical protein [Aquimarina sp. SS2-1]|uniref:hypothetical protein n=1 Tax=Aquimarina besae TaxID=3342247 RepID=UPI00366B8F0C